MGREVTQFQPGSSGNPAGRPKGSKNKLSEDFLHELYGVFQETGREAIQRMCNEHPAEFVRCIAALVPKELLLEVATEQHSFVINAKPRLTEQQWRDSNGLNAPTLVLDNPEVTAGVQLKYP